MTYNDTKTPLIVVTDIINDWKCSVIVYYRMSKKVRVIHRNVFCRNCLDKEGNRGLKIFGMSRFLGFRL